MRLVLSLAGAMSAARTGIYTENTGALLSELGTSLKGSYLRQVAKSLEVSTLVPGPLQSIPKKYTFPKGRKR